MRVKVKVYMDRMGDVIGYPVRQDIQDMIINHLQDFKIECNGDFFFQEGMGAEEFKQDYLSSAQQKSLESGWDIYINIDPWILGHFYGWDTYTLFE